MNEHNGRLAVRPVNIRYISTSQYEQVLIDLQTECLPGDIPLRPSEYGGNWWIAFKDGEPVGFSCFKDVGHDTIHLARAGVLEKCRGQGLYPRLIRAGLRDSKLRKYTVSITDCTTWNASSANGLLKAGYKPFWPHAPWGLPDSIYWIKQL